MPLQATRTIGTGDGWQRTDSGILLPDWADLLDTPPTAAVGIPQRQSIGIDLFAGAGVLGLVMFVYMIVLLVFYCLPGTSGANRFGDDPYGANVEEVFA